MPILDEKEIMDALEKRLSNDHGVKITVDRSHDIIKTKEIKFTIDCRGIERIGNERWRMWHTHLYDCICCKQGNKCIIGQSLFNDAETQNK